MEREGERRNFKHLPLPWGGSLVSRDWMAEKETSRISPMLYIILQQTQPTLLILNPFPHTWKTCLHWEIKLLVRKVPWVTTENGGALSTLAFQPLSVPGHPVENSFCTTVQFLSVDRAGHSYKSLNQLHFIFLLFGCSIDLTADGRKLNTRLQVCGCKDCDGISNLTDGLFLVTPESGEIQCKV